MMDAILAHPRGVGRGSGTSLVTGKEVGIGPDLSMFVASRADAYRLVEWVTPLLEESSMRVQRIDRAYVDYRKFEPQWLQVKLVVEDEHEEVLQRLSSALYLRDGYLDEKMIRWAIDPANHKTPWGYDVKERMAASERAFNPTTEERYALDRIARDQDLSIDAVMRQALRFYQLRHEREKAGETFFFSGDAARQSEFVSGVAEA